MPDNDGGPATSSGPRTAVIAFVARYTARLPFARPVLTLLKEYLPVARPVACNELLLVKRLCGLPETKYLLQEVGTSVPGGYRWWGVQVLRYRRWVLSDILL